MNVTIIPTLEYMIRRYRVGRATASKLRRQASAFVRMGFDSKELTVLAPLGIENTATYEIVPLLICKEADHEA